MGLLTAGGEGSHRIRRSLDGGEKRARGEAVPVERKSLVAHIEIADAVLRSEEEFRML